MEATMVICNNPDCEICKYTDFAEPISESKQQARNIFWFVFLCVITLITLLALFSPCKANSSIEESIPEKASYQIRCEYNSTTFAICSGTAIAPHFYVSCAHVLDDVVGLKDNNVKASVLIGNQWYPIKLVKYTSWKTNGDIDLSLWLLPEIEFPEFSLPGIVDLKLGDRFNFVGFGLNDRKRLVQVEAKELRDSFQKWAADFITSPKGYSGDSGGGTFYGNTLVGVRKSNIYNVDRAANSTNIQLINFLYPGYDKVKNELKTQCYSYGGSQYCVPAPRTIMVPVQPRIHIGPVQNNVNPPQKISQPVTVQPNQKKETFAPETPKIQPDLCKPFKDKIVKLENDLGQVNLQLNNIKTTTNTQINHLTAEKDRLFKEKQDIEADLAKAKRLIIYFTLEGEEACQKTDVEASRIREEGLNVITVVMKRQDVTVNSVPRLFLMPERRTVYGEKDCLTYLQSMH